MVQEEEQNVWRVIVVLSIAFMCMIVPVDTLAAPEFHRAWVKDTTNPSWHGYQCGSVRFEADSSKVWLYTNVPPSERLPRKHSIKARFVDAGFSWVIASQYIINRREAYAEPVVAWPDTADDDAHHVYILEFCDPRSRNIEQIIRDLAVVGIEVRRETLNSSGKLTWDRVLFEPF